MRRIYICPQNCCSNVECHQCSKWCDSFTIIRINKWPGFESEIFIQHKIEIEHKCYRETLPVLVTGWKYSTAHTKWTAVLWIWLLSNVSLHFRSMPVTFHMTNNPRGETNLAMLCIIGGRFQFLRPRTNCSTKFSIIFGWNICDGIKWNRSENTLKKSSLTDINVTSSTNRRTIFLSKRCELYICTWEIALFETQPEKVQLLLIIHFQIQSINQSQKCYRRGWDSNPRGETPMD